MDFYQEGNFDYNNFNVYITNKEKIISYDSLKKLLDYTIEILEKRVKSGQEEYREVLNKLYEDPECILQEDFQRDIKFRYLKKNESYIPYKIYLSDDKTLEYDTKYKNYVDSLYNRTNYNIRKNIPAIISVTHNKEDYYSEKAHVSFMPINDNFFIIEHMIINAVISGCNSIYIVLDELYYTDYVNKIGNNALDFIKIISEYEKKKIIDGEVKVTKDK